MNPARLEALRAMARQDESPNERDIARDKLLAMGEGWDEPPRRPPAAPAPGAMPWGHGMTVSFTSVTTNTTSFTTGTFWVHVETK